MKLVLWLFLLPAMAAGCIGGGTGRAVSGGVLNSSTADAHNPLTDLRVSYPVGGFVLQRSQLAICPRGATCHDVHMGCPPGASCPLLRPWTRVAVRRLTCSPSGGDYQHAGAACAALDDLEHRLKTKSLGFCSCPGMPDWFPRPQAAGRYKSYGVKIALDPCSLCGIGTQAAHDAVVLMP
jgi:hypothetical protein